MSLSTGMGTARIVSVPIPSGGATGQALLKSSGADYDLSWGSAGGTPGFPVDAITTLTDTDNFLVYDSSDSNAAKSLVGAAMLIPIPALSGGRNFLTSSDISSILDDGTIYQANILGSGTIGSPSMIAKENHPQYPDTYAPRVNALVSGSITAAASIGATTVVFSVPSSFTVGEPLGIYMENNRWHWTTVTNTTVSNVDFADPLPVAAASGAPISNGCTPASHSTIIGSYDMLNSQQASALLTPHSVARATGTSGHNSTHGGSWHRLDGTYNSIMGGGGGPGSYNEFTAYANSSGMIGGRNNTGYGDYNAFLAGFDKRDTPRSQLCTLSGYSVICDWAGAFVHGGRPLANQGDNVFLEWTNIQTVTQTNISLSACRLLGVDGYALQQFNNYNTNVVLNFKISVTVTATAGTNAGKINKYLIEGALTADGTIGGTGWQTNAEYSHDITGENQSYNQALTVLQGDDNIGLGANVPALEWHNSAYFICRVCAAATVATTVVGQAKMEVTFHHFS
jgi:hypothetical protein